MTVIVIIGIVAVIAMPTMLDGRREQRAYDDAAQINELMRNARARAIGRGTATLMTMDTTNNNRGRFRVSEATGPSPQVPNGILKAPRTSCMSPDPNAWVLNAPTGNAQVNWALPNQFIDGIDLNGTPDTDANVWTRLFAYGMPGQGGGGACTTVTPQRIDICFTPSGRPFASFDTVPPIFTPASAFSGVVEVQLARLLGGQTTVSKANARGVIRHILLPPSGISRISSENPI